MKIVVSDTLLPEVLSKMEGIGTVVYKPNDLNKELEDADALVVRSATKVTRELLSHAKKLKVVARAGVGLDNVDIQACQERAIKVVNTPSSSTNAVAELAMCFMICLLRKVCKANSLLKGGKWEKNSLVGNEIAGKTLGIVGFGRIGFSVGQKAHALGMKILAYDPHPKKIDWVSFVDLDTLYKESDIISLHTILVPETRNMINSSSIAKMKQGVYLMNIARGELVDENALYDACKSGKVAGAALDVFPSEPYSGKLLGLDNICATPHIGASTNEAQSGIGEELIIKLKEALSPSG
ncbi:MAG: hydroxyacid dehydrogenase [Candidatus Micrarchaeota archaeon]